jgi:WxcM-like, C-terminal
MANSALIDITKFRDDRGDIVIFENGVNVPFELKRVYLIRGVPLGKERGYHAHRKLRQLLIALNGSVSIELSDGSGAMTYELNSPEKGLYLYGLNWRVLKNFSPDCVLMVLASEKFDPEDYIDDYEMFLKESTD